MGPKRKRWARKEGRWLRLVHLEFFRIFPILKLGKERRKKKRKEGRVANKKYRICKIKYRFCQIIP